MAAPNAIALHETNGRIFVICPHCEAIHEHEAAITPRLIEIDAQCDESKHYIVTPTMKPKNFVSAIHLYEYELQRKRAQYRRKKTATAESVSSGSE